MRQLPPVALLGSLLCCALPAAAASLLPLQTAGQGGDALPALCYGMLLALALYHLLLFFSSRARSCLGYAALATALALGQLPLGRFDTPSLTPDWPLAVCCSGLAAIGLIVALRRRRPGARYLLLASIVLTAAVSLHTLRKLALLPDDPVGANVLPLGCALALLLLALALAEHTQAERRTHALAQAERLSDQEKLAASLRETGQRLEQLVDARTRELARVNARLLASESKLSHMAHHDPLTGLANRLLLHERLNNALLRARKAGEQLAVLAIDLDGFKPVNDTYGHETGDKLLVEVAKMLQGAVRADDTVARVGGDEFVVVLTPLSDLAMLGELADRITAAVKQANRNAVPQVSASIGIALHPLHGDTLHDLLHRADVAMYAAKSQGRDRWHLLDRA